MKFKDFLIKYKLDFIFILLLMVINVLYYYYELKGLSTMKEVDSLNVNAIHSESFKYNTAINWTNSVFSGLPFNTNYAPSEKVKWTESKLIPSNKYIMPFLNIGSIFGLKNISNLSFMLSLGMFILLSVFGFNSYLKLIISAIYPLFLFTTLSIEANHINKILVLSYIAPIIGGIILVYKEKYLLGALTLSLSFLGALIYGHPQILYYGFIIILIYGIIELIFSFKDKTKLIKLIKGSLWIFITLLISFSADSRKTIIDYFYIKQTMRGGSELSSKPSDGLEKNYAFSWSMSKLESLTNLIPRFYGGSSHEKLSRKSNYANELSKLGVDKGEINNIISSAPTYWGDQPFTSGPYYLGAGILFLFILSLFVIEKKYKIWLISSFVVGIFITWGNNLPIISDLLFDYMPLYNKFRSVSMATMIQQIIVLIGMGFILDFLIKEKIKDKEKFLKNMKMLFYSLGGICLFMATLGTLFFTFKSQNDASNFSSFPEQVRDILYNSIINDRKSMMQFDAIKSLFIIVIIYFTTYYFVSKKLNAKLFIIIITLFTFGDILFETKKYFNGDDFLKPEKISERIKNKTEADDYILQDKDPHYRVLNLTSNIFNDSQTPKFHKSIGGYSPIKLGLYQDLIDNGISQNINTLIQDLNNRSLNFQNYQILNMLNTKYIILGNNAQDVLENKNRFGNVWHVKKTYQVENGDQEVAKLNSIDLKNEAVLQKKFANFISQNEYIVDESNYAKLTYYYPDTMIYEVNSNHTQLLVFSEIYFNKFNDWTSYVDNVPKKHFKVNFCLRGIEVPAGKHEIKFIFKPWYLDLSFEISAIGIILLYLFLIFNLIFLLKKNIKFSKK